MRPRTRRKRFDTSCDIRIARDIRPWICFFGADFLHRRGVHPITRFLERLNGDIEIGRVREGAIVEDGGGGGVGGVDGDGAAAEGLQHGDGDSVTAAEGDFLDGGVGGFEEIEDEVALG